MSTEQTQLMILDRKLFDATLAIKDAQEKYVLFSGNELQAFYDAVEALDNRIKNARVIRPEVIPAESETETFISPI